MLNKPEFYEVVVTREQYYRIPIVVFDGITQNESFDTLINALDKHELKSNIHLYIDSCCPKETNVQLKIIPPPTLRVTSDWEKIFGSFSRGTNSLIAYVSKTEDGKPEVVVEDYRAAHHGEFFGNMFSNPITHYDTRTIPIRRFFC